MNAKNKLFILTFFLVCLTASFRLFAQGPGFDDDVIDEVPLDGGVTALAVAGVGYAIKKMKESRNKNNNDIN